MINDRFVIERRVTRVFCLCGSSTWLSPFATSVDVCVYFVHMSFLAMPLSINIDCVCVCV